MTHNLAWTDIAYRTQQVEFPTRGVVRDLNDEHCCPQKKAEEEQPTTLERIIR